MERIDGRKENELRKFKATPNMSKFSTGSVLMEFGETRVICSVMIDEGVPPFLKGKGQGWLTAEYSMLPYSTHPRVRREGATEVKGRSQEIQRLIGRSLRSVFDMQAVGEKTVIIDCDVLQADGGTRTTSINGAFLALSLAVSKLMKEGVMHRNPIKDYLAAISVGVVGGTPMLDLAYAEDSKAEVDMNIVAAGSGDIVEVQGTGEGRPFSRAEMDAMVNLALSGISSIIKYQQGFIKEHAGNILLREPAI
ncbi:MAG: ribonuclease PH [Thermoplasmata archaeon]